ncbi:MAG: SDR family oxidoreductase [Bacteroidales bacterium]|nr:SDR family oxidoreductase [Bacteroidales bacterium]
MNIRFDNKIVLITGSSRGIGAATALKFAESGATVIVHYSKDIYKARETFNSLPGSCHMLLKADLSVPDDVKRLFDKVLRQKGRIDILVNNAGIYEETRWWELDYEEWQQHWKKTIDTNLTGMANLSFLVAKQMIAQGGGKIINVSSRGAFRGEPHALPYGAGKAAMNSFGQSMAWALADKNVQVYTIAPGWVDTDMTHEILESEQGKAVAAQSPMNRFATPGELANAITLLASSGTEYMTGCILDMNGASYLRT